MTTKTYFVTCLSILFFTISFPAQSTVPAALPDSAGIWGRIENGVYENPLFGFRLKFPADGVLIGKKESEAYRNAGVDMFKNKSPELDKRLDEELKKQSELFHYANKPIGTNPNAVLIISAVKEPPNATASAVIAQTLAELKMTGNYELSDSSNSLRLGGRVFSTLKGTLRMGGISMKQEMMATMTRGYAIFIAIAWVDDGERKKLDPVLQSLKFFK